MTRPGAAGTPLLLVLRALGLGDFLTGLPALRGVVAAFAEHHLVLAMPPGLEPLLSLAGVAGDVLPVEGVRRVRPFHRQWAARYGRHGVVDVAVNLHGRGPESHRAVLRLSPRRMIAFSHPHVREARDGPEWREGEHEVARWCRLLRESGIPAAPDRLDLLPPPVEDVASDLARASRGATVVHPGAASGARRWPADRWAEVARHEWKEGRRVLVTGAPSEVGLATAVASRAGLPRDTVLA
ncbi:MAG: glycosyltransferase family 9 protein, partial [Actinomycetota bacterium]|nr:glycosyltransferase family 9 protein [Actinomycetota bacterium]